MPSSFPFLRSSLLGLACAAGAVEARDADRLPNPRLKLSARGGHFCTKKSVLSVAAAGRSLSAIR